MTPATRSCATCATPVPGDALFCPACGAATPTEFEPHAGPAAGPPADSRTAADAAARRDQLQRALGSAFELRDLVGQGGFGEVWAAWDVRLKRDVAVKVLLADLAASPGLHTRFAREAEAAARLRHPNIVPIYQVGETEGLAYIIMPLVRGESLRAVLQREGALPIPAARRILAEAAAALDAAHKAGIVHRDVKPENIMLEGEDRRVLLMDFGIARAMAEDSARLTGTGLVIGTPQYMSPEQATAEKHIDHRADIYSLGVVAYEALTGKLPFEAETTRDLIVHHLTKDPRDPRATRAEIPEDVADAILKCMAKEPGERWASAGALAVVLQPPVTTTEESPLKWITKRLRAGVRKSRRRIVIYATALAAVIVTLALFSPGSFTASIGYWQWRIGSWFAPPARPAEAAAGEASPWQEWSQGTDVLRWGVVLELSSLGDSLLLASSPGSGPLLFDGRGWRVLPIEPGVDDRFVQPALRARDGTAWIYVVRGAFTVGYQLARAGPVARDTVRGRVETLWSDGNGALLGLRDGGLLRGQPTQWRREATGTRTRLAAIWGDSARQFALGYFAGVNRPDSLLVFNGLNWGTVDPRPSGSRHWVYNAGAVLSDGTFVVAGEDCALGGQTDCRGLLARLAPDANRWVAQTGMPGDVDFRTVVATRSDELWLVGLGDGCPTTTCVYRVAHDRVQAEPDFGRHQLNGLALLGGEPLATTSGGTLWVHRGGQWGLLGVVPGALATGILPGGGIFNPPTWSEGTVVRAGVAGVRRIVALPIPGRETVWYAQRPVLRYEFPCAAGESLTVSISPARTRMYLLDPDDRSVLGGFSTTGTLRWRCPDNRRYRFAVPPSEDGRTVFTLGLHRGWARDSLPALPPHAGPAGTIAVGSSVTGDLDDGARLRTAWLTTAGAVLARACDARLRCTEHADLRAPGAVRDITGLGDAFIVASGAAVYAHRGRSWDRIAAEGPMPPVLALGANDATAAALTDDAVWRLPAGAARWRRWQAVPSYVGRPRRLALAPDGRSALVLGELSVALLREGAEPRELRITTSPSDGVILPDGRVVLALPSDDPLVGGHLAVFNDDAGPVEQAAPSRRNVWALAVDGHRLFATASGWTTLAIDIDKLPLAH